MPTFQAMVVGLYHYRISSDIAEIWQRITHDNAPGAIWIRIVQSVQVNSMKIRNGRVMPPRAWAFTGKV